MSYDIHIELSDDPLAVSDDAVSFDHGQFSSVMRYVYQSSHPLMYRFSDFLRDATIEHDELPILKAELANIISEMTEKKKNVMLLSEFHKLIDKAYSMDRGLRSLCD